MSKRKSTIRRTNSADTFPNVQEYDRQRKMSGLSGHDDLSVLAANPSYTTTLNDSILPNSGKKDNLQSHREELANLQRILDIPIPGQSEQLEKYDGDGLPPTTKSSRNRTPAKNKKKEPIEETIPEIINARDLPRALPQPVHTLMTLNPQAAKRRTTKVPKKKSKGGKNKTKKRKAKKTKKNKKNKK